MKTIASSLIVLGLILTAPAIAHGDFTCEQGGQCQIGDRGPGGGTVFYVAEQLESWGRYIEAAPAGWYKGRPDPNVEPFCYEKTNVLDRFPDTSPAIGTGKVNTDKLLKDCPNGAAAIARTYRGGGFVDWSLPSKDEFNEMYFEIPSLGLNEPTPWYWSSTTTIYGQVSSFYVPFARWDGTFSDSNDAHVRPVRHFMSKEDLEKIQSLPQSISRTLGNKEVSSQLSGAHRTSIANFVADSPERLICTSIIGKNTSKTQAITLRKRAKAICDYAKKLKPSLSIWVQSKTTDNSNAIGMQLLTKKIPIVKP